MKAQPRPVVTSSCQPHNRARRLCAAAGRGLLVGLVGLVVPGCGKKLISGPWIHKIQFTGVKKVKLKELRPKLLVQESSWFPLAPKHYLDNPFAVDTDRDRIEAFYHARGYYAAKVTRADTRPYKGDQAVDIAFTVIEGEPTRVHRLKIEGLAALGDLRARLLDSLPLHVAEGPAPLFDHDEYLRAKQLLLLRLRRRGYAFATVDGTIDVNRDTRLADVTIVVEPGQVIRLGEAQVQGTTRIPAAAVQKYAAVPTGERYKPKTLEAIQDKIYSLSVFSTVRVELQPRPTDPRIGDVAISVTEGPFRELRLGGGLGIEPERNEVHLEATFIQRHFLGGLRVLQVALQPGYAVMPALWTTDIGSQRSGPILGLKIDFSQPDVLGINSAVTASLVYDLGLEYAYQYHGPGVRLGLQKGLFSGKIKLAGSYNFQFLDFFNPVITEGKEQAVGSLFGYSDPYRLGYLQEQVVIDLRNRSLDASKGFFLGVLGEQGGVWTGSAFSYQKLQPELRGYVSVGKSDRLTFAARLMFGQLWVQGDTSSPITQRLYLGGPGSHRGFSYNRLAPQVCTGQPTDPVSKQPLPFVTVVSCNNDSSTIGNFRRLPIGGDQMVLGQLEARLKLFTLAGNWLSLAAFADAGDVAAPACPQGGCSTPAYAPALDLKRLHVAVGGGLRYRTVIGTVRFDLGVRLNHLEVLEEGLENPDPGQRFAYHISIGESF